MTILTIHSPHHHVCLRRASQSLLAALQREHPIIVQFLTSKQGGK